MSIKRRVERLENRMGEGLETSPEVQEVLRAVEEDPAYRRVAAEYGPILKPVHERCLPGGEPVETSLQEEEAVATVWSALHEAAQRIAQANGVPYEAVLQALRKRERRGEGHEPGK